MSKGDKIWLSSSIWPWRSRSIIPKNDRDLNQGLLHRWSKFGDSSLNEWWVIVRTSPWLIHTCTDTRTHRHTEAGNDNTRRPKLASGKKVWRTDRRTDRQKDGRTENTIHRSAWSQLKILSTESNLHMICSKYHNSFHTRKTRTQNPSYYNSPSVQGQSGNKPLPEPMLSQITSNVWWLVITVNSCCFYLKVCYWCGWCWWTIMAWHDWQLGSDLTWANIDPDVHFAV